MNDLRRYSTSDFPEALRRSAWDEVLAKVRLVRATRSVPPVDDHVALYDSPLGSVFLQVTASPQTLSPLPDKWERDDRSVLLLALLSGHGEVTDEGHRLGLSAGDIILLDPRQAWHIELNTSFRAVLAKLEPTSFVLRLVRAGTPDSNRISTESGVGAVCLNLIQSIGDELGHLKRNDFPPLEATLIELLMTCLSRKELAQAESSTAVQLAHLRRICRSIESRLGDPGLQLDDIARLEGFSTRYLQKLFKASSTTFNEYLKTRRLERCRFDLSNPALSHFSISELCFRWGFSDAANFSRAFSKHFGTTPKAYRMEPSKLLHEPLHRGRPQQSRASFNGSPDRTRRDNAAPADEHMRRRFRDVLDDHARYALSLALAPKRAASPNTGTSTDPEGRAQPSHYYVPVSEKTVHWGYFSRSLKPILSVQSGDILTIETLTQHASDDWDRMVKGDPGAESVFHWTAEKKTVDRRGAGPMDATIFGRGAGEGFGVHICTGPVYVKNAEPGDVLEIRILDIQPRPSCNPPYRDKVFGSNAATWWGFHYDDLLTEPKKREVVTIYEINPAHQPPYAKALYNYRWTPQTDPFGVVHPTIDYPGIPVNEATIEKRFDVLKDAVVPIRPHFGVLSVAPREPGPVDSIPPSYFGGNLDNWRAGKGSRLFLPVSTEGALFSVGDPHASQGDSELCGTAIECSLTGVFQLVLHKRRNLAGSFFADLNYPFLDTDEEWVLQGLSFSNYLAELGPKAQAQVYKDSSLEAAMRDAFRNARHYLMKEHHLSEDEAISLISVAVDFGITQVVDGNIGVHAIIRKNIFPDYRDAFRDNH